MPIKVNREQFLLKLKSVEAGLSPREIVEQSSCFAFKDGKIRTFNEDIACSVPSGLPSDVLGAVQAAPLLAVVSRLAEDEIELEPTKEELVIVGKRKRSGIRMEQNVLLATDSVETPKEWVEAKPTFFDALSIVQACAGKDESAFEFTCVHIHPKWIEASDNFQIARYRMTTGVKEPILVKRNSIKYALEYEFSKVAETATWIHFKSKSGLVHSYRRHLDKYKDMTPFLEVSGRPCVIPRSLAAAVENAEIFTKENADMNLVGVELRPGKLRIKGTGASGWYQEVKKLKYDGEALQFMIAPKLLVELVKRYTECEISSSYRLKVTGEKWVYVAVLLKPQSTGAA